ncbi:type 4 pilus major pilin [Acidocella sp.]|uniref:type 4 pilus major pilin n=1 Tax=Acidocella sp. TaxID=50710 RepID=UPI003CFDC6C0
MSEILGTLFKYLLGLLAIVAVVVVLYEALSSNKVSTAAADVTTLQSNVAQLYGGTASTASLSDTVVISAKAAPNSMVSGNTLLDPWAGAVTVQPDANPGEFDIILAGIPQAACNKLATAVSSYKSISINGTADTSPVDPGTVATQCTSGGNNQIQFTFAS